MLEIIFTIILFGSIFGMAVIIFRKIPTLSELSPQEVEERGVFDKLKEKIKNNGTLRSFSGELLLQKLLSKIRILTSKTDKKTNTLLTKLRQKSLEKKNKFSGDYWKKLKRK